MPIRRLIALIFFTVDGVGFAHRLQQSNVEINSIWNGVGRIAM